MKYAFSLGKNYIYWCRHCNLPLLEESCNLCKENGEMLKLSPPADIRFCSRKGLELIKNLFLKNYGTANFLNEKIVLLNKIAGLDRCDQIFIDGYNIGTLSYDLKRKDFYLSLSVYGAMILAPLTDKKTVICDKKKLAGKHLKGKGIGKDDILEFAKDIETGDDVIVKVGNAVGVGTAKFNAKAFPFSELAAIKLRDISSKIIRLSPHRPSMTDVIKANLPYLKKIEVGYRLQ